MRKNGQNVFELPEMLSAVGIDQYCSKGIPHELRVTESLQTNQRSFHWFITYCHGKQYALFPINFDFLVIPSVLILLSLLVLAL